MKNENLQVSEMYKSDKVVRVSEGFGTSSETDVEQRTGGKNFDCVGALRYALHIRFQCPSPRKCSRSVEKGKSKFLSQLRSKMDDEERKIYLYNDLRVVFSQRHSDADEEKCVVFVS
ncbi:hypothetical protein ACET3Z_029253 [Daucus carota]